MTVEFLTLRCNTNGSGDGSQTDTVFRSGKILAVGLDYASSTDAGADVTISVDGPAGPAQTVLTVTNNKTDGWYYPRAAAVTPANVAITNSFVPIPFFGALKLTIAQGGASVTDAVAATIYMDCD